MIRIENGKKSYDGRVIWENLNLTFSESGIYCLMGPSGQGKTTLLRCLAGLETLDGGTIHGLSDARISMVFQEDRLIPELTAAANLKLVGVKEPLPWLREILPEECLAQPVSTFSGGMKRRAAVARAMAVPSAILLMDEPFTGLDEKTKEQVISFVLRHRNGRLLIAATHQEEEARALGAGILRIEPPPGTKTGKTAESSSALIRRQDEVQH